MTSLSKLTFALQSQSALIPSLPLPPGTAVLGRSSKCTLVVKQETVSRCHAIVVVSDDGVKVEDLNSVNGVYIDDLQVKKAFVSPGQTLRFGSVPFVLAQQVQGNEEESEIDTVTCEKGDQAQPRQLLRPLTHGQSRVLPLLLKGHSERQIAEQLGLSVATVHNNVSAIYRAYQVHSRAELLVLLLATKQSLGEP